MKKNLKIGMVLMVIGVAFFVCVEPVFADEIPFTLIPRGKKFLEGFKTGNFSLQDVLVYIKYLIELAMVIAAGASLMFVIIGGFNYVISPIVEDKEAGKKTITNALMGLTISILGWVIINTVLYVVTS